MARKQRHMTLFMTGVTSAHDSFGTILYAGCCRVILRAIALAGRGPAFLLVKKSPRSMGDWELEDVEHEMAKSSC